LTQTLDYYQEIGIRLNVVPQVSEGGYINMIIHPSITSSASNVSAVSISGNLTATTNYPIIDVREAQTQIMMRDGETVVIGGLLKDVKSKSIIGVPFLSKIPFIGALFRRETIDTAKIDLLIFITARVMKEDEFSPDEIKKIEAALGDPLAPPARKPKEKKK
jgi:type II secretory pathway component GspD/PulD (secretin)